jgi:hypothetical protein
MLENNFLFFKKKKSRIFLGTYTHEEELVAFAKLLTLQNCIVIVCTPWEVQNRKRKRTLSGTHKSFKTLAFLFEFFKK